MTSLPIHKTAWLSSLAVLVSLASSADVIMETIIGTSVAVRDYGVAKYAGVRMELADFLQWESDDSYMYEYNNGILEPTTGMKQSEVFVLDTLEDRFYQTDAFTEGGRLRAGVDVRVSDQQVRRPDISLFSRMQLLAMAKGQFEVPYFVIELVSENDDIRKYIKKLPEYFRAGVQVVWLVFPDDLEVYVYTSPKTVTICTDDDVLSAAPALSEFQLTVNELFKR